MRINELDDCLVQDMNDGGMGSLRFVSSLEDRQFGSVIVEAEFDDEDGTLVSATVNLDKQGMLFEVDLWKVDFSKLRASPATQNIRFK